MIMIPAAGFITPATRMARPTANHPGTQWIECDDPMHGISRFIGKDGVREWHVTLSHEGLGPDAVEALEARWLAALRSAGIDPESTVLRRVFCSDVVNQRPKLGRFANAYPGAFSAIGQTPSAGGRFAIWSYHLVDRDLPVAGEYAGWCPGRSITSVRPVTSAPPMLTG